MRRIIAISEATAADLRRLWGVDPGRIEVVLLGSEMAAGTVRASPKGPIPVSPGTNTRPRESRAMARVAESEPV